MSSKIKTKSAPARPGFVRQNWRERVDFVFLDSWASQKENRLLGKIRDEKRREAKFKEWYRKASVTSRAFNEALIRTKDSLGSKMGTAVMRGLDIEEFERAEVRQPPAAGIYPQNPESSPIFRQMVFLKYGITFRDLIYEIDINKNAVAHRRLMAVHRDYWRLLSETDFSGLKLKFSVEHFGILTQGSAFGLDGLTAEELAECLDQICPCCQKHSPEYLKKLRGRIRRATIQLLGRSPIQPE